MKNRRNTRRGRARRYMTLLSEAWSTTRVARFIYVDGMMDGTWTCQRWFDSKALGYGYSVHANKASAIKCAEAWARRVKGYT